MTFFLFCKICHLNYIYVLMSFTKWLGMECAWIQNIRFARWGHIRVEQWRFLSFKAGYSNYISKSRQMML